jgi:hypothetical protein
MTMQRQGALRPSAATFAVRRRNTLQRPDDAGSAPPHARLLFRRDDLLFAMRRFAVISEKFVVPKNSSSAASH